MACRAHKRVGGAKRRPVRAGEEDGGKAHPHMLTKKEVGAFTRRECFLTEEE